MPTAVVTGGAGFLGSHLCDHLVSTGHRVICVDNLLTSSLDNIAHLRGDAFAFLCHDVTEPIEIAEPVDVVYHFAALASPIDYLRMPLHSLKVGSYGTHNALGLAKWKRARFLLAASGEHLPVNLGNPRELTLLELAETVIRVTSAKSELVFEALPVDDPQVRQPDITRARQLLGWEPQVTLEEGLRRMLQANERESLSV